MGKRKVFIGIEIPEEVRKQLWGISNSFQKFGYPVSWVREKKFHLTFVYLGYIAEEKLDTLIEILQEEVPKFLSFDINLGNIEGFPNAKNPRVIVIDTKEGKENLEKIYNKLGKVLISRGFSVEERGFSGHVTLGRVKSNDFYVKRKISEMMRLIKVPEFKRFEVPRITLFESIFVGKEFIYNVLLSVTLGGK